MPSTCAMTCRVRPSATWMSTCPNGSSRAPNLDVVRRTPLATARTRPCRRVNNVMIRSDSPSFCTRSTTASSRYSLVRNPVTRRLCQHVGHELVARVAALPDPGRPAGHRTPAAPSRLAGPAGAGRDLVGRRTVPGRRRFEGASLPGPAYRPGRQRGAEDHQPGSERPGGASAAADGALGSARRPRQLARPAVRVPAPAVLVPPAGRRRGRAIVEGGTSYPPDRLGTVALLQAVEQGVALALQHVFEADRRVADVRVHDLRLRRRGPGIRPGLRLPHPGADERLRAVREHLLGAYHQCRARRLADRR